MVEDETISRRLIEAGGGEPEARAIAGELRSTYQTVGARFDSIDLSLAELAGQMQGLKGRLDGIMAAAVGIGVIVAILAVMVTVAVAADTFGN